MHILFCHTNQKNLLQKEIKDWTFEAYLLTEETSSRFLLTESLKMTCARSYAWFLNFLSNGEGLDCLSRYVLPKLSKITVTCPKLVKEKNWVNFDLPKVSKMNINFELLTVAKWPVWKSIYLRSGKARNIKFGQQVNIIERVPLSTSPQEVVVSFAHNHVTNLFVTSYRGATVIKIGQ